MQNMGMGTADIRLRLTERVKDKLWKLKENMRLKYNLKVLSWEIFILNSCGIKIR